MKITMKEKVLQFVEQKGEARFTDIQCFIVDTNYGVGTYLAGYKEVDDWVLNRETKEYQKCRRRKNVNRGYYCGAFSAGYFSRVKRTWDHGGYFMRGDNRLEKNPETGKYRVIRQINK